VSIRWLGTAGHVISTKTTTVLIDPYLSRPSFRELLLPIRSDETLFNRWLPEKIDAVLLGHSHFDHLLDAPAIAKRYRARVVGSATTSTFARAAGVPPERIDVIPEEGRTLNVGDIEVTFIPSLHGRLALGRVPFPGTVTTPPNLPRWFFHYKMGGAFGILLRTRGRSIYHNGSADLIDAELDGSNADVLLVGLAGRRATRDYLGRLTTALRPSVVIPTHHDSFFASLDHGERLLPGIDLDGFFSEMNRVRPDARVMTPLYDDELLIPCDGDPRSAFVVNRHDFARRPL
jgi:L-ascorbate metabolism protein UlaG (beta-lactamase superfamily)